MSRRLMFCAAACGLLLLVLISSHFFPRRTRPAPAMPDAGKDQTGTEVVRAAAEPTLPETKPPPGLPIIPWGPRDYFHIIRQPTFVSAREGDHLLAHEEPVLGLVVGNEARAYSTNQLNKHEMVLDEIAGTPVLVTY